MKNDLNKELDGLLEALEAARAELHPELSPAFVREVLTIELQHQDGDGAQAAIREAVQQCLDDDEGGRDGA